MNYCSTCGSSNIIFEVPAGDSLRRHICQDCGIVFYENPKIVTGCILEWQRRILLCKRAIEPRSGLWTIPAGFMEKNESVADAAARETLEEACAVPVSLELQGIYNLKHISQVYIVYRGVLQDGHASPGKESLEVALCDEDEVPWEKIAFPVITTALKRYFKDCADGKPRLHSADITRDENGVIRITESG